MKARGAIKAVAAAVVALALSAGVARSAEAPSAVFAAGYSYLNNPVVVVAGSELSLVNLDASEHSVTAVEEAAPGVPLFDSGVIGVGQVAKVRGVASLAARAKPYRFVCVKHSYMKGDLYVM